MPDFWSHQIAAKKAYTLYSQFSTTECLFENAFMADYYFGAQGPDFYYYINQKKPFSKRHYSTLGTYFHLYDVYKTLNMLLESSLQSNLQSMRAYVAGYLTHYILDAQCHPMICTHAPDSRAHKVYELALDTLCVQHYEHLSIHAMPIIASIDHTTEYLANLWQPIITKLSIESTPLSKDFEGASSDMFVIQKILLSDIIRKKPWIQNFSQLFKYDLSQLMYPRNFTEAELTELQFDVFNVHFMAGIERSALMLKKLEALYIKDLSKEAFLEWLVTSDYLGEPIKDGGKHYDF